MGRLWCWRQLSAVAFTNLVHPDARTQETILVDFIPNIRFYETSTPGIGSL